MPWNPNVVQSITLLLLIAAARAQDGPFYVAGTVVQGQLQEDQPEIQLGTQE